MQNEKNPYIDHSSWMDCLGQLGSVNEIFDKPEQLYPDPQLEVQLHKPEMKEQPIELGPQMQELINLHECIDREIFKRSHSDIMMDDEFFTSSSSQMKVRDMTTQNQKSGYKKQKYAKQYIYSKNYRDKKKQQFKLLQQQNQFLKNKIEELQARLREKELEINRLKHHSVQKQLTIEQLNRQFLTKVSLFAEKIQSVMEKQESLKLPPQRKSIVLDQLIRTYDEHGFSGSRKREILGYYMDEILEVVLRDSEKYLCMLCCKNKDDNLEKQIPEYQKINNAFFDIMQLNPQDEQRLKKYIRFLFPIMKDIKKQCSDMYKNYSKILHSMDRVHQFMRMSYGDNLDFVKKRMKMESWFQYHKYHKIMRRLKSDWLDFIKKQRPCDGKDPRKPRSPNKKHKTDQ